MPHLIQVNHTDVVRNGLLKPKLSGHCAWLRGHAGGCCSESCSRRGFVTEINKKVA